MPDITSILTAFGLSTAAGLNAYIPLLLTGLVARYTDLIHLEGPFATLENPWVLLTLAVLLLIEMLVDKIPAVDSLNDVIHTVIRPAAGAILFAASAGHVGVDPTFAAVLGLIVAGSIHATKSAARPVVTASTLGTGNALLSAVEDGVSLIAAILAIFLPAVMGILGLILFLLMLRWWLVRRAPHPADAA